MAMVSGIIAQPLVGTRHITETGDTLWLVEFTQSQVELLQIKSIDAVDSAAVSVENELRLCDSVNQSLSAFSDSLKLDYAILRDRARQDSTSFKLSLNENVILSRDKKGLTEKTVKLERTVLRQQNAIIGCSIALSLSLFGLFLMR